jgi:hypothetical protein
LRLWREHRGLTQEALADALRLQIDDLVGRQD